MKKLIVSSSIAAGLVCLWIGVKIGAEVSNSKWHQDLVEKGYAEYNKRTGYWQLCEPEVALLNRTASAIKVLNGGTLTINDYLKIVENDLREAKDCIENQRKELAEQDLLLEKYKKNIKITNDSKPSRGFDVNTIISAKDSK